MALTRWDPWGDLARMREDLDDVFGRVLPRRSLGTGWMPAADISKVGETLVVKMDLPGMSAEDVDVTIAEHQLVISGERKVEVDFEEKGGGYFSRERMFGSFVRRFTLPADVDEDQVDAEFADGELTVTMPLPVETKPKQIDVKSKQVAQV
jgi:HSP20 family protein